MEQERFQKCGDVGRWWEGRYPAALAHPWPLFEYCSVCARLVSPFPTAYIAMDELVLRAREVSHKLALIWWANQCSYFGLVSRGVMLVGQRGEAPLPLVSAVPDRASCVTRSERRQHVSMEAQVIFVEVCCGVCVQLYKFATVIT